MDWMIVNPICINTIPCYVVNTITLKWYRYMWEFGSHAGTLCVSPLSNKNTLRDCMPVSGLGYVDNIIQTVHVLGGLAYQVATTIHKH